MKKLFTYLSAILIILSFSSTNALAYSDVDETTTYSTAIDYISDLEIVGGYPDGTYQPERTLNRAELLKIVVEANFKDHQFQIYADENCFTDIAANQWYTKYICFAEDNGIVNGYPDGNFRPADEINLVEAVKIAMEVFGYAIPKREIWYQGYIEEAAERNFIPVDFTFFDQKMNRGQMADLITRILKYRNDELAEYLGDKFNNVVNFTTLENNIDLSGSSLANYYEESILLGFKYPSEWTSFDLNSGGDYFEGSYRVTDESEWQLNFGPRETVGCDGADCYPFAMEGFEPQDEDNVKGIMEDDSFIKILSDSTINQNRVIIYEETGICVNLSAVIFAGDTIMFKARCVDSEERKNNFYQVLSTVFTGESAPLNNTGSTDTGGTDNGGDTDNNNTSQVDDRVAQGAPDVGTIEFAIFESSTYHFQIEYFNQWYFMGTASSEDGVTRKYIFSYDNPEELEEGEDLLEEVAVDLMDSPYSGDSQSMEYGSQTIQKVNMDTEIWLYTVVGGRTYRLTGAPGYEDIMIHMALSIQEI